MDGVWSSDRLAGIARGWREALARGIGISSGPIAMVMENNPLSVALFFALSSFPVPLVLLAPDPKAWRSSPPIPPGTPLALTPSVGHLAAAAEGIGLQVTSLPGPRDVATRVRESARFLTGPGMISFTSGSTGAPRPVYRTTANLIAEAAVIADAFGLSRGDAVLGALPLFRLHGLKQSLFVATVLSSTLGLVERFDYRSVLALFASERYRYCPGSPLMAETLSRCPLPEPVPAPRVCTVATGSLPRSTWDAFRRRFGVPLRGLYGTTESGVIAADGSPPAQVRPGTVGRAVPGVEVHIGDGPDDPLPRGEVGRIWIRSPWYMAGYGFPPELESVGGPGAWTPTRDLGSLDAEGYLLLAGRVDDHVKTRSGYLVDPAEVADVLRGYPGVTEVVVVPLSAPTGSVIGALVESDQSATVTGLRRHAGRVLPTWSQPQVVRVVEALPRLLGGKIDRTRCIAILEGSR